MNSKSLELLEKFAPKAYVHQAYQTQVSHENEIRILLEKVCSKFIFCKRKNYIYIFLLKV